MTVYYIGGSPCSGKSTVAEALAKKYGLLYFRVDDHLEEYMKMAAAEDKLCCKAVGNMLPDQIWMRDAQVQCDEELAIYEEIGDYVQADLQKTACPNGMITEGAAFLPLLAGRWNIPIHQYVSITPTKEFQVSHYRKREWVPYVLAGCSDKDKAFSNWMDRDHLFAGAVQRQCDALGYVSLINNGEMTVKEMTERIARHFGLEQ